MKKYMKWIAAALACLLLTGTVSAWAEEVEKLPRVLPDGVYTVDFSTDSGMFRANEACDGKGKLTVQDGVQPLHVSLQHRQSLSGDGGTGPGARCSLAGAHRGHGDLFRWVYRGGVRL